MIEYKKRIKSSTSLVFSLFFLFCIVAISTAQTPQQIAQKAFRSTVLLVMEDTNGQPLSLGSGFFEYFFSLQDFANLLKYGRDIPFRKPKLPKSMNVTKLFTSLFKQDDCLFKTEFTLK